MPRKILPRIVAVTPGELPMTLRVRWDSGKENLIDLSGIIRSFRVYAPLRQSPELLQQVRIGEYGTDVVWTDAINMSADTLWRLTQEQLGETMTPDAFRDWRERKAYTLDEAARALGLSRRMVAYYEKGDRPIPRVVALATTAASTPSRGNALMIGYEEIEDINDIDRLLRELAGNLISLSDRHEVRTINT